MPGVTVLSAGGGVVGGGVVGGGVVGGGVVGACVVGGGVVGACVVGGGVVGDGEGGAAEFLPLPLVSIRTVTRTAASTSNAPMMATITACRRYHGWRGGKPPGEPGPPGA